MPDPNGVAMEDSAPTGVSPAVELTFAQALLAAAQVIEPAAVLRDKSDRPTLQVPPGSIVKICQWLRDDPSLRFDTLYDHTAIDWPDEQRFELTYLLASILDPPARTRNLQIFVTTSVPRDVPVVDTVCGVWPIAQWQEREVYDLFGVLYAHHPDLRRLFLEDDWEGFPLRKDYEDDFMLERPT